MDFNSLDAIEFFQDGKKHLRVYYQTTNDNTIRESSYDDANGWFVRGNGVVAYHAKKKSPISVTRWNDDNVTSMRVYYLDSDNKIRECRGKHTADVTTWEASTVVHVSNDPNEPKVAEGSQLAVARPETNDNSLRIFYEEKPATTNAKSVIREIKFTKARGGVYKWDVQVTKITGALASTRLSAVSAKPAGDIRLYYQAENGALLESFWNNRNKQWNQSKALHRNYDLVPQAPIRAVSWFTGEQKGDSELLVRIYTILKSKTNSISELSFDEDWDGDTTDTAQSLCPATQPAEYAAIATARRINAPLDHPITLFYHARQNVIGIEPVPVDLGEEYKNQAQKVVRPHGIPTSRLAIAPILEYLLPRQIPRLLNRLAPPGWSSHVASEARNTNWATVSDASLLTGAAAKCLQLYPPA
ncbi:hypothetical protein O1611_g828 [Lasiodiplodia mahajangana]|uniref:Uncharacterized protein n=1 Tax=Lasiodiplodia mahajangana TaxID=1108764 RepID=A0ACC2JZG1_9PEZI|nr:hypothetical protein O1611_g828 [Lasiodiplodia mahajangana]